MSKTRNKRPLVTPDVRVASHFVQGYGGPDTWYVRAVDWANNRLLEEQRTTSAKEAGRIEVRLEASWVVPAWSAEEIATRIAPKQRASPWCSGCGGHTLGGAVLIGDKTFCKRCEARGAVEDERLRITARLADDEQARQLREAERVAAYRAEAEQAQRGFHWRDGWFFARLADGAVHIARVQAAPSHMGIDRWVTQTLTIPENEWASIVCSVSAFGETGETWQQQRDFHSGTSRLSGVSDTPSGEPEGHDRRD